jgi:hypothetical protein
MPPACYYDMEICMSEFIHEHPAKISDHGVNYSARVYGKPREDGTWEAWLEFHPTRAEKPVLRTEAETSQPNRTTIEYWALGLEPLYLEGALARAQHRLP